MKTSICLMIFVVFLLSITGCEDDMSNTNRKIVGTGPVVTSNLDLSSFTSIENTGVANINVALGSPQSVVLKAQQNIMDVMTYEVIDHALKIGFEKNVSIENSEEIRFDITIPAINKIELEGVGNYVLSGDYQDELTIILTGVGMCEVQVIDKLNVTIIGVGNVFYKGDPTISSTVTGLGSLIDANH